MFLLDTVGRPLPPSGMVDRLRQVHPNLGIVFTGRPSGGFWWGISMKWEENDPRWSLVRENKTTKEEAFDIVCMLPEDCSVDQAYGYFVNGVKAYRDKPEIHALMARTAEFNKTATAGVQEQVLVEAMAGVVAELGQRPGEKQARSFGGIQTLDRPKRRKIK